MKTWGSLKELIIIVIIIGIVLLFVAPHVLTIIKDVKVDAYDREIAYLEEVTKLYLTTKLNNINIEGEYEVTLNELVDNKMLNSLPVNPINKKKMDGTNYILITKEENGTYLFEFQTGD